MTRWLRRQFKPLPSAERSQEVIRAFLADFQEVLVSDVVLAAYRSHIHKDLGKVMGYSFNARFRGRTVQVRTDVGDTQRYVWIGWTCVSFLTDHEREVLWTLCQEQKERLEEEQAREVIPPPPERQNRHERVMDGRYARLARAISDSEAA